jgi:hypothetical protein
MKISLHVPEVELGIVSIIAFGCFGSNAYISCLPHPELLSLCHEVSLNIIILSTERFVLHYPMGQDTFFHAIAPVVRLHHKKTGGQGLVVSRSEILLLSLPTQLAIIAVLIPNSSHALTILS